MTLLLFSLQNLLQKHIASHQNTGGILLFGCDLDQMRMLFLVYALSDVVEYGEINCFIEETQFF